MRDLQDSPFLTQVFTDGYANASEGPLDLASARSLQHYPIYIIATRTSSAALASWRRQTQTLNVAALLAAIVVVGMLAAIIRYLKEQHRRLDIAVNNMSQGLLLFDASERLVTGIYTVRFPLTCAYAVTRSVLFSIPPMSRK